MGYYVAPAGSQAYYGEADKIWARVYKMGRVSGGLNKWLLLFFALFIMSLNVSVDLVCSAPAKAALATEI